PLTMRETEHRGLRRHQRVELIKPEPLPVRARRSDHLRLPDEAIGRGVVGDRCKLDKVTRAGIRSRVVNGGCSGGPRLIERNNGNVRAGISPAVHFGQQLKAHEFYWRASEV